MHIYIWTSIRAIILWSLKALGQRVLVLLSGNSFYSSGHRDLDLWSTEPEINRVLLLNKGYHPMKFEGSGSKRTWVIVFTLWVTVTLTFDLLTSKSIGVFYSIRATTLWSLKALGQRVLELLSGNVVWQTDRQPDGQTDKAKTICLPQRGGPHNNERKLNFYF